VQQIPNHLYRTHPSSQPPRHQHRKRQSRRGVKSGTGVERDRDVDAIPGEGAGGRWYHPARTGDVGRDGHPAAGAGRHQPFGRSLARGPQLRGFGHRTANQLGDEQRWMRHGRRQYDHSYAR
jgi:hypothetical protein